ncbi:Riboflavin transporter MCH5 [Smittium culicis]|uniref:Riboflavin transporter MCH5 n=1 Tax=Smittium culicis TaxID=133412 RepID=A0A1R1X1R6_9FUNG|nr:Riboflavin transporter MCH5 [Smittium culicis]
MESRKSLSDHIVHSNDQLEKSDSKSVQHTDDLLINESTAENAHYQDLGSDKDQLQDFESTKVGFTNVLPPDSRYGWFIVASGFFLYCNIFGTLTVAGIFQEYYLNNMFPTTPASTISWISTVNFTLSFCGGLFAGPIMSYIGIRYTTLLGVLVSALGMFLSSFCSSIWQLVLTYGLVYSIGTSLLINVTIIMPALWFDKHRGIALAIISSGSGFGGLIIAPILRKTLVSLGIHWSFRILGIINLFAGIISFLIFKQRAEFKPMRKVIDFKLLKRPLTLFIFVGAILNQFGTQASALYYPASVTGIGKSQATAANLVLIYSVCGGIGRIFSSMLSRRIGSNNTLIFSVIGAGTAIFALWLPSHNFILYIIFITIFGILYPMAFPILPLIVANNYESSETSQMSGLLFCAYGLGSLSGIPLLGVLFDKLGHRTSFTPVIVSGGIIYYLNAAVFILLKVYAKRNPNVKIGKM